MFGALWLWGVCSALFFFAFIGVKVSGRIRHWFMATNDVAGQLLPGGSSDRIDRCCDTTPVFHGDGICQHVAKLVDDVVRGSIAELG
jgi:hypothetical protein